MLRGVLRREKSTMVVEVHELPQVSHLYRLHQLPCKHLSDGLAVTGKRLGRNVTQHWHARRMHGHLCKYLWRRVCRRVLHIN